MTGRHAKPSPPDSGPEVSSGQERSRRQPRRRSKQKDATANVVTEPVYFPTEEPQVEGGPRRALIVKNLVVETISKRRRRGRGSVAKLRRFTGSVEKTRHIVFDNFSLSVGRGERVGLVVQGPQNGAKLLQAICETIPIEAGSVRRSGNWIAVLNVGQMTVDVLTLRQNIHLCAGLLGHNGPLPAEKVRAVLDMLGVGNDQHQPMRMYESSLKKSLVFATASQMDADVYCFASPFEVRTSEFQVALQSKMNERVANGASVIVSSTNTRALRGFTDRNIEVPVLHQSSADSSDSGGDDSGGGMDLI